MVLNFRRAVAVRRKKLRIDPYKSGTGRLTNVRPDIRELVFEVDRRGAIQRFQENPLEMVQIIGGWHARR
jgi:hypothetical protein